MSYVTRINILVIEDDSVARGGYSRILNDLNEDNESTELSMCFATTVDEGINKCIDIIPDITIVDLRLSDGSGIEVLEFLHKNISISDIYSIIITGNSGDLTANINKYNDLGIDKVWIKPLSKAELVGIFKDAISKTFQRKRNDRYYSMLQKSYHSMHNAVVGIIITDAKGSIEYVNSAFLNISGYELGEVIGQPASVLKSGCHEDSFYADIWKKLVVSETVGVVFINKKKDGTIYYQESTIMPYTNNAGEITNYIAQVSDITEKRRQELEFEAIITTLPEVIMIFDRNRVCIQMYPNSAEGDFKILRGAKGKSPLDMKKLPEEMRLSIMRVFDEVDKDTDNAFYHEYELPIAGGNNRFFEVLSKRFNSEKYMITIRDITDSRLLGQFHKFSNQISRLAVQNDQLVTKYLIKNSDVHEPAEV